MNMRRHTLSRGKQWICPGLTQFTPKGIEFPLSSFTLPTSETRHSQMTGKAWPTNLFKLRWNWQQKCATYFARLTIHESNLSCNKSSFCRLPNAVELLINFCNNFSQPATICIVARRLTHKWYKALLLALSQPAIWGSNICKALE